MKRSLVIAATAAVLIVAGRLAAQEVGEYALKAAFLYNFAKYVEWPQAAFGAADDPIVICSIGADPIEGGGFSFGKKTISGRRIWYRHLGRTYDVTSCHVVFVEHSADHLWVGIESALHDRPVLTVGETDDFIRRGGVIGFGLEDQKLRFEINDAAARRTGLKISSQLLKLARRVIPNEGA